VAGLGGAFTYARVGPMLFSEYRDLGRRLPAFEEIARYVFFTETSRNSDPRALDSKTGRIGEWKGTSSHLLYTPNRKEDCALDKGFIADVLAKDKNPRKAVYCEKVWVHREDLAELRPKAGEVRPMLVPFNLN
jgi:adenine-specific DNA-methyltransferase